MVLKLNFSAEQASSKRIDDGQDLAFLPCGK